jgi:hypothetical protein
MSYEKGWIEGRSGLRGPVENMDSMTGKYERMITLVASSTRLSRFPSVDKAKHGVKMNLRITQLSGGFRYQDLALLLRPPQNPTQETGDIRMQTKYHLLALVSSKGFQSAVFRPGPNRHLIHVIRSYHQQRG